MVCFATEPLILLQNALGQYLCNYTVVLYLLKKLKVYTITILFAYI